MQALLLIDPAKRLDSQVRTLVEKSGTAFSVLPVSDIASAEKEISSLDELPIVLWDADSLPGSLDPVNQLKTDIYGIKIVLVSEYTSFDIAKAALRLQINGLISYPIIDEELSDILSVLAPYIVKGGTSVSGLSRTEQNELIKKKLIGDAIDIVEKDIDKDLSLDYVAARLSISPCYLSSLFHKVTGQNFMSYVTASRLEKAARLLETTNLPVNEVARRVGYHNPPYFSTIFKKKYGFIPSRLRGMNLKK